MKYEFRADLDPTKVMIYERDNDYKYVVSPYERTGMANVSYWHQHITKTAVSYHMPENVSWFLYCSLNSIDFS